MYQTLYRKYRPQTFSDVCGQERVTTVLRHQVREGTLTHAYLFCGTRGTGKTTCAKILAKVANCLDPQDGQPCNRCVNCQAMTDGTLLDVLEVDAASNTGVDNIRRLCEELNFLPAQGKKRVYIIDEVHMLSAGAFNALLKTLEEPPEHVLFILATTELHKVPATVRSRCQCLTFQRLSVEDIAARVLYVSEKENIQLDAAGASLIARLADGAMRDALSLLELCVGYSEPLDEATLNRLFGLGEGERIKDLALCALSSDNSRTLRLLEEMYRTMGDLKEIMLQVLGAYRDMLLYSAGVSFETASNRTRAQQEELAAAAKQYTRQHILFAIGVLEEALVRFERLSVNKKMLSEIALMRICTPELVGDGAALEARVSALEASCREQSSRPAKKAQAAQAAPVAPQEVPQEAPIPSVIADELPWETEPAVPQAAPPIQTDAPPALAAEETEDAPPFKKVTAKKTESGTKQYFAKIQAEDAMLASFCSQMRTQERDDVLYLYGPSFTITMLLPQEERILESARQVSPGLKKVVLVAGDGKGSQSPSDLTDF